MDNLTIIKSYYDSSEPFPIPFDEFWQWVGYATKQKAEQNLFNNFQEGTDYLTFGLKNTGEKGRPSKDIRLSIDCAKSFAMLAQTDKGKEVRSIFCNAKRACKPLPSRNQPLRFWKWKSR